MIGNIWDFDNENVNHRFDSHFLSFQKNGSKSGTVPSIIFKYWKHVQLLPNVHTVGLDGTFQFPAIYSIRLGSGSNVFVK